MRQENKNRQAVGPVSFASLEWLVVAMTDSSSTDYTLREMVLLLHPRFCSSPQLARALIRRFDLVDGSSLNAGEGDAGGERAREGYSTDGLSNGVLGMVGIAEVECGRNTGSAIVLNATLSRSQSLPVEGGFPSRAATATSTSASGYAAAAAAKKPTETFAKTATSPTSTTPSTSMAHTPNQYNSPANQKLRVKIQVLSVFSKWIKSDLFSRQDKSAGLLHQVCTFLRRAAAHGSPGQRKLASNLLLVCNEKFAVADGACGDGGGCGGGGGGGGGNGGAGSTAGGAGAGGRARSPFGGTAFTTLPHRMGLPNNDMDPRVVEMIVEQGAARFFYQHTPREVAMALTYVTYDLVSRVSPQDLVSERFGGGSAEEKTARYPSYMRAVRSFNGRVRWIQAVILCEENGGYPRRRSVNITFFIDVATECLRFANFQTTLEVVSALSAPCIGLVSNNMAVVSERSRQQLANVKRVLAQDENYERYRTVYASCRLRPHVPLLPVTTQDLMRLESGSRTFHASSDRLINVRKFNKVYATMETFLQCREKPYTVRLKTLVPIATAPQFSDDEGNGSLRGGGGSGSSADGDHSATDRAASGASGNVHGIDFAGLLQRIGEHDDGSGGGRGSVRSLSSLSSPKGDLPPESVLVVTQELVQVMSKWLCPPPSSTALYTAAARILATESKNLVATLDYLGL